MTQNSLAQPSLKAQKYMPLKYLGYSVVFQEIPNETTLAINISGCPRRCEGCHSPHLWEYRGSYISDDIEKILAEYKDLITCVCFMGGEQNVRELCSLLKLIKEKYKLKTALYTGDDPDSAMCWNEHILKHTDYIKYGSFHKDKGGLSSPTTNQQFFTKKNGKFHDITKSFQRSTYS